MAPPRLNGNINDFRNDHDLRIFLTFDGELEVRGKNAKEKITSWFNKGQQAFDNIISDKQTDPDDFYESKKLWLNEYHTRFVFRPAWSPRDMLLCLFFAEIRVFSLEIFILEYKTVGKKQMNLQKPIAMSARIMAPSVSYQGRQLLSKLPGKFCDIANKNLAWFQLWSPKSWTRQNL